MEKVVNPKPITCQKQLTMFFFYWKNKPDASQLHLGERAVISAKSQFFPLKARCIFTMVKKEFIFRR